MKMTQGLRVACLLLLPIVGHAFSLENAAQGMAESAARKAATGAAREAVDTVFNDDAEHAKHRHGAKGKGKSHAAKGKQHKQRAQQQRAQHD